MRRAEVGGGRAGKKIQPEGNNRVFDKGAEREKLITIMFVHCYTNL